MIKIKKNFYNSGFKQVNSKKRETQILDKC